jgi:hypothetical protein
MSECPLTAEEFPHHVAFTLHKIGELEEWNHN